MIYLDALFSSAEIDVVPISREVIDKATELRAQFSLKTPDALHIATAILGKAKSFLTGDKELAKCTAKAVELV